ncbi:hypothetical protein [Tenacibaculum xiamenense]|uniref:hypothetical protein n=1 Tax=Tenacibaculum xiamenense TaxID=1261553 RepID=UPI0038B49DC3
MKTHFFIIFLISITLLSCSKDEPITENEPDDIVELNDAFIKSMTLKTQNEIVELSINGNKITGILPLDFCYKDFLFEYELSENSQSLSFTSNNPSMTPSLKHYKEDGEILTLTRKDGKQTQYTLKILPNPKSAVICSANWKNTAFQHDLTSNIIINHEKYTSTDPYPFYNGFIPHFTFLGKNIKVSSSMEIIGENHSSLDTDIFNLNTIKLLITSEDNTVTKEVYFDVQFEGEPFFDKDFKRVVSNKNEKNIYLISDRSILFFDINKREIDYKKSISSVNFIKIGEDTNQEKLWFTDSRKKFYNIDKHGITRTTNLSHPASGVKNFKVNKNYIWLYSTNRNLHKINTDTNNQEGFWNLLNWFENIPSSAVLNNLLNFFLGNFDRDNNLIITEPRVGAFYKILFENNEPIIERYWFDSNKTFREYGSVNGYTQTETIDGLPQGYNKGWYFGGPKINDNIFMFNISDGYYRITKINEDYIFQSASVYPYLTNSSFSLINPRSVANNKILVSVKQNNIPIVISSFDTDSNNWTLINSPSGFTDDGFVRMTYDSNNNIYLTNPQDNKMFITSDGNNWEVIELF